MVGRKPKTPRPKKSPGMDFDPRKECAPGDKNCIAKKKLRTWYKPPKKKPPKGKPPTGPPYGAHDPRRTPTPEKKEEERDVKYSVTTEGKTHRGETKTRQTTTKVTDPEVQKIREKETKKRKKYPYKYKIR